MPNLSSKLFAVAKEYIPGGVNSPVRAFTLMEVILALATSAVLLAAVGSAFFSALRLRDRAAAALDESGTAKTRIQGRSLRLKRLRAWGAARSRRW